MGFAPERREALIEIDIGSIGENLDKDPDPDFDRLCRVAPQKVDASAKIPGHQGSLAPTAPAILMLPAEGSARSHA